MAVNTAERAKTSKKKKRGQPVGRFAHRIRYYDYNLVAVVILLTCFGLVMLYSTSSYMAMRGEGGNDMAYFGKQAVISTLSLIGALVISRLDYHVLFFLSPYIYVASMFFMFLVRTPLGVNVNGATRWIQFGPDWLRFQPAEIAKIAVITFLPCLVLKIGRNIKNRKSVALLISSGGILALTAFLVTDNLSTGIIIGAITVLIVFISHPKTRPFMIAGICIGIVVTVAIIFLHLTLGNSVADVDNFRLTRILVWLRPERYSKEGGYQIMQALYAIGSGGFFGKGLGNSVQKLGPVPEAQNDMIFSIICEELGVFGGMIILLLFAYLLYRLFFIAQNAPDLYGSLMVSGIFFHIALQVILNICVVINLIPTTGITLPFVSYGGTSILFLMAEMGIALSVSKQIRFEDEKRG